MYTSTIFHASDVQVWKIMCYSMYYLNTPLGIICPWVNTLSSSLMWPLQTALILSPPHHLWSMGMYQNFYQILFMTWNVKETNLKLLLSDNKLTIKPVTFSRKCSKTWSNWVVQIEDKDMLMRDPYQGQKEV